jgi:hypothetical protein
MLLVTSLLVTRARFATAAARAVRQAGAGAAVARSRRAPPQVSALSQMELPREPSAQQMSGRHERSRDQRMQAGGTRSRPVGSGPHERAMITFGKARN